MACQEVNWKIYTLKEGISKTSGRIWRKNVPTSPHTACKSIDNRPVAGRDMEHGFTLKFPETRTVSWTGRGRWSLDTNTVSLFLNCNTPLSCSWGAAIKGHYFLKSVPTFNQITHFSREQNFTGLCTASYSFQLIDVLLNDQIELENSTSLWLKYFDPALLSKKLKPRSIHPQMEIIIQIHFLASFRKVKNDLRIIHASSQWQELLLYWMKFMETKSFILHMCRKRTLICSVVL